MITFDLQLFADPNPPDPPAPNPPAPSTDDELGKLTAQELVGIVKDLRRQNAGYRGRVTTLEGELKATGTERDTLKTEKQQREQDEAKKRGDFEKLAADAKADADAARADLKKRDADFVIYRKTDAVRVAAMKLGIVDPGIVGKIVDVSGLPDDQAALESAATEMAMKMKADQAYLFAQPPPSPAPTPSPGAPPPLPAPGGPTPPITDARVLSDEAFAQLDARLLGRA